MEKSIVLASASPRRRELVKGLGLDFTVEAPDVDERPLAGEEPEAHALRLASLKARTVAGRLRERGVGEALVVAADTVVAIDGRILGKPADGSDAAAMLRRLSGRTHRVVTALCVTDALSGRSIRRAVTSRVTMRPLSEAVIEEYLASGESMDKAGAYAVQGLGARLVERVEGSYTNVVGLPVDELIETLASLGLSVSPPRRRRR
ncbi:MAG TPA: septum formation inhibitor Maf [Deltaproteobacteria bacterium]|nr:septum formation inhibitor Maf [Deltaproteobacteria bacterium]